VGASHRAVQSQAAHVLPSNLTLRCFGRGPTEGKTIRASLLAELGEKIDLQRMHFLGKLPYSTFVTILQISCVHVY